MDNKIDVGIKAKWENKKTGIIVLAERRNEDYVKINNGEKWIQVDAFLEEYRKI